MNLRLPRLAFAALLFCLAAGLRLQAAEAPGAAEFHDVVQPILKNYCYDCHGDGESKGKVAFDQFKSDKEVLQARELWWKALKNVRAGIMPPAKRKARPTAQEKEQLAHWIKGAVFDIDPQNPDPGSVTLRRLNRAEYHNTIRDLLGVDFDTQSAFPPDDTGYGFDTIGDVLTLPPMLLEKYILAAEKIVGEAVPVNAKVTPEKVIGGRRFEGLNGGDGKSGGPLRLSFYKDASVSNTTAIQWPGHYKVAADLVVNEHYVDNVFDLNKCELVFSADGRELLRRDFNREDGKKFHFEFDEDWAAGDHHFAFQLEPLTDSDQNRALILQITSVTLRGPTNREHWVKPAHYSKYFPKPVPPDKSARRAYARELLAPFARRAFRRPADDTTVGRLVDLAQQAWSQPGKTFEAGIAEAMVAVLASPQFLFLEERPGMDTGKNPHPLIDEYSLASRLSYFLWSSMPDDELLRLAGEGRLRQDFTNQVARLLRDKRSDAFVRDFTGQWLRGRDIESVQIDTRSVLAREQKFDPARDQMRKRFRLLNEKSDASLTKEEKEELAGIRKELFKGFSKRPRVNFDYELRNDMRMETEDVFDYVLRQDRSALELLDSDYTFLNHRLAEHYGITNVTGDEMRRVTLPPDSPRGGILTEGAVLVVTSNPTRTSPVKRGLFILDSVLGTPPPPPPPNIPPLEDAAKGITNHAVSLRDTLAMHRKNPLCSSCHGRMDPLGLAFENFNALGMWRQEEFGDPIDAAGSLITGESFTNVHDLKRILVTKHSEDFYRTLTEKMLTYALGRGLDYYDVETVDKIVASLRADGGRMSTLLAGVVDSAPFQKCRRNSDVSAAVRTGRSFAVNSETH